MIGDGGFEVAFIVSFAVASAVLGSRKRFLILPS